jgi:hypothetical protein
MILARQLAAAAPQRIARVVLDIVACEDLMGVATKKAQQAHKKIHIPPVVFAVFASQNIHPPVIANAVKQSPLGGFQVKVGFSM